MKQQQFVYDYTLYDPDHDRKLINEVFQNFSLLDGPINSYNQIFDRLDTIINNFQFKRQFKTEQDQEVLIQFELKNMQIAPPQKSSIEILSTRSDDFSVKVTLDYVMTVSLVQTKESVDNIKYTLRQIFKQYKNIPTHKILYENMERIKKDVFDKKLDSFSVEVENGFQFDLPMITGAKYDIVNTMSDVDRFQHGYDNNFTGGDIILKGTSYSVQNTLSYPYNKPIVTQSNKDNKIVQIDFLSQQDPVYGNTYYVVFNLLYFKQTKQQDNYYQFVTTFNQPQENELKQKVSIPIELLFRAYGVQNDLQIIKYCNPNNDYDFQLFLIRVFQTGQLYQKTVNGLRRNITQLEAILLIGSLITTTQQPNEDQFMWQIQLFQTGLRILSKYYYPLSIDDLEYDKHPGTQSPYLQQLGEFVERMYQVYKNPENNSTDRDDLKNKRVKTIGAQVVSEIRNKLQKTFNAFITNFIQQYIKLGYEAMKQDPQIQTNITRQLQLFSQNLSIQIGKSFSSSNSSQQTQLRKVINEYKTRMTDIQLKREIVIRSEGSGIITQQQREIHYSHFGFVCFISTPEGGSAVGRYLAPTMYAYFSTAREADDILNMLQKNKYYSQTSSPNCFSVKINYITVGFCKQENVLDMYQLLMDWRRQNSFVNSEEYQRLKEKGLLNHPENPDNLTDNAKHLFTGIYYSIENRQLNINTDMGRILVPILKQRYDGKRSFRELLESGDCIYIDQAMGDNFIIHEYGSPDEVLEGTKRWFYLPYGCVSSFPAISPLINTLNGVRMAYSTNQLKQNIARPYSNFLSVMANNQLVLHKPQYSPVKTGFDETQFKQWPITETCYVAFLPDTMNQEDSIIVNEGFIKRGGFRTSEFITYVVTNQTTGEQFQIPENQKQGHDFSLVNSKYGMISDIGLKLHDGSVLVSKVTIQPGNENFSLIDQSTVCKMNQEPLYCVVTSIPAQSLEDQKQKLIKIQFAREPIQGDKFVSRNGFKATIGHIVPEYEMPILENGIIPSIIHNIPSVLKRETFGQFLESQLNEWMIKNNKLGITMGIDQHFPHIEQLQKNQPLVAYSGLFNTPFLSSKILGGVMSYAPQKHIVANKIRARDTGQKDQLTRQPTAGKRNKGGLKFGDLDMGAIHGQGISQTHVDIAGKNSTDTVWMICKICGNDQVYFNQIQNTHVCPQCGMLQRPNVHVQGFNYAEQLFSSVLYSVGVGVRFTLQPRQDQLQ